MGIIIVIAFIMIAIQILSGILNIAIVNELREKNLDFLKEKFGDIGAKNLFFVRNPIRDFKLTKFVFSKKSIELIPDQKIIIYFQRILFTLFILGLVCIIVYTITLKN